MEGFFSKKETESASRPDGKTYSCVSCGLYKTAKTPRMKPYGNFRKGIMNLGEAPGEVEDRTGKPFQGKTGQLLQQVYKQLGIDLFEDCINVNACHCRPVDKDGHNIPPTNYQIESCRRTTLHYIKQYKPKVIVALGNSAMYSVLAHRWKKDFGTISKWRGWTIPDQDLGTWLCPTFHPSFVERSDEEVVKVIWKEDLKTALKMKDVPFLKYKEPEIEVIEDLRILNDIKSRRIAFDYETTGKKPHAEGHRIVSCAVADTPNHCYVFLVPTSRKARQPLIDLLARPDVGKIAQNMKFEETWSVVRLHQPVVNWSKDTMLMSHVLDNRYGITGLKYQVYVQFGVVDYSSELDPYLKPKGEASSNSHNRIFELLEKPGGRDMLLKYNALDAIFEFRLAEKQEMDILSF